MNIKPLKNQVLVRLLPREAFTDSGLVLPDIAQESPKGEKRKPRKALVVAIGNWRTTKQGFSILPDFHVGQRVLINTYAGTALDRGISEHLRLCRIDDVLAVCEEATPALG